MRVVVSGSSGFVGRRLVAELQSAGHEVLRLVRGPTIETGPDQAIWDPRAGELEPSLIEHSDVIVNLCGRNIGAGRWTPRVKRELQSSRIETTRLLASTISRVDSPPRLLVNASAVGFYGDRGDDLMDESSAAGNGFLAELSVEWEAEAIAARSPRTQVALLRLGMVIGPGGALARMLPIFKLGLGGPVGNGRQWWPWIALGDVTGVIRTLVEGAGFDGPLNLVSPHETRCKEFSVTLGRALHRPAVLTLPAFAARLAAGEMAEALLLASTRVRPRALLEEIGYSFQAEQLADALRQALD